MPSKSDPPARSPSRLSLAPISDARVTGVLVGADADPVSVSFESLSRHLEMPEHLDGFIAVLLPALLRTDAAVHVSGTLTREAVRNLIEFSEGWENWNSGRYHALRLSADRVIDPPLPAFSRRAAFAWSGSLRSTHTLVRHHARRVPGAVGVARIVHVIGLQGDARTVSTDAIAAEVNKHAERLGATVECVVTNAREVGLVEAEMGMLPVVAAALHLTAADLKLGFHARRWPFSAQLRYPRPDPAFPDLFCGSRMLIRADGGVTTPTQMVREILEYAPFLLTAISGCSERPRFTPPCGVCSGCVITSLAFAAAGISHHALPPPAALDVARLQWSDPIVAAEATEIASDWSNPGSRAHLALRRRVKSDQTNTTRVEVRRWLASASGLGPIWPR
jgi:hypothetical protein